MRFGVEMFWVARYDYHPDWRFEPHSHDFFQLIYIIGGKGEALLHDAAVQFKEGQLLFIPPGTRHALSANAGVEVRTIDMKFDVVKGEFRTHLGTVTNQVSDERGIIRDLVERIHLEGIRMGPWYRIFCNSVMMQTLVEIARLSSGDAIDFSTRNHGNPEDELVQAVTNQIHRNFSSELTVQELGTRLGYSAGYLSRSFRQRTGFSIHSYIMRYRIYRAKELLKYTGMAIKEIASATGFKDVHHFTRTFRSHEQRPPAQWRSEHRDGVMKDILLTPGFEHVNLTVRPSGEVPPA